MVLLTVMSWAFSSVWWCYASSDNPWRTYRHVGRVGFPDLINLRFWCQHSTLENSKTIWATVEVIVHIAKRCSLRTSESVHARVPVRHELCATGDSFATHLAPLRNKWIIFVGTRTHISEDFIVRQSPLYLKVLWKVFCFGFRDLYQENERSSCNACRSRSTIVTWNV